MKKVYANADEALDGPGAVAHLARVLGPPRTSLHEGFRIDRFGRAAQDRPGGGGTSGSAGRAPVSRPRRSASTA